MKRTKLFNSFVENPSARTRLGFTQQQFADHLGVSRSLVSMAEQKKRLLPTPALVKLAELEIKMAGETMMEEQTMPHPAETNPGYMNEVSQPMMYYREMACRRQADDLSDKLTVMCARYRQLRANIDEMEKMLGNENSNAALFSPGFLEMHRHMLLQKLAKCSLPAQANLRNRIALLYAEAELSKGLQQQYTALPA